jgi:gamma-glutamyltranspeptidase / glutathione hydrolase
MSNTKGVVAAGHELTVSASAEILEEGGNAFDAALAGAFMTFVAEAVFAAPGGGGFLMARRAGSDKATLFDFFVETPLKRRREGVAFFPIHADFGPAKQEFHIGLGSSATPGAVPGLFAIHEALCRLPMKRLVEPAARAAREGFPLSAFQAYLFTVIAPILTASASVRRIFAPGGKLMTAGEIFRNEELGECLEWVAEDGPRLFVDGDVGRAIAAESLAQGGHLTERDLKQYGAVIRDPLYWRHKSATVALNPPPAASGALIAFGLAYLEAISESGGVVDALALRQALAAMNEARDRHGKDLAERLAGGVLAQDLREARRHTGAYRGTTHVSVIDGEGNAAAISLSNGEGNGFIVGKFGFMLNNMLGEEDLASGGLDAWRPGTRLSSMMAPTLILEPDGTITALGSGGSNRIKSAILQVAANLLDRAMSLEEAVEAPRLHVERDGIVSFEPGFPERAESAFRELGGEAHAWPDRNLFFGGVHAARRHGDGGVEGAGDPRRSGQSQLV